MGLLQTVEDKELSLQRHTVIVSLPLVDKSQTLTVYKIQNLSTLVPELCKCFRYNIPIDFIPITTNSLYIHTKTDILSCQLSSGHYCETNTQFYPINSTYH